MGTCEACHNHYDSSFTIMMADGSTHVFDCFECAIHKLAPRCAHCSCPIIGHGIEKDGSIFCCENCVRHLQLQSSKPTEALSAHARVRT